MVISIHAPRMGSDVTAGVVLTAEPPISIHAPRMGSDLIVTWSIRPDTYFNPRSPDGERPPHIRFLHLPECISIHAPRMGSDLISVAAACRALRFQSTLPGWGATGCHALLFHLVNISIHAPRMGSDSIGRPYPRSLIHFNPRSPDGERRDSKAPLSIMPNFNPRSPDGERLSTWCWESIPPIFQSTLPGWGATCLRSPVAVCFTYFNPRSPDGERLRFATAPPLVSMISIHAPRMGSDETQKPLSALCRISIHAPRMGSDRRSWFG